MKIQKKYEFLYFYCFEDRPLWTNINYTDKYLSFFDRASVTNGKEYDNWWGNLKNLDLEKKLNSKKTIKLFYQKYSYEDQYVDLNSKHKKMFKYSYGVSGIGHSFDFKNHDIIEKYFEKKDEVSILYDYQKKEVSYLVNSYNPSYKGGIYFRKYGDLLKYFNYTDSFSYRLNSFIENMISFYSLLGASKYINFDLIISDNIYLIDVNYRKSMGYFHKMLHKYFNLQDKSTLSFLRGKIPLDPSKTIYLDH